MVDHPSAPGQGRDPRFATVLDEAITRSGLSLTTLAAELSALGHPISRATLGYWRSGRSEPERVEAIAALPTLARLLGTPPDRLIVSLGAARVRGRAATRARVHRRQSRGVFNEGSSLTSALEALGVAVEGALERTEVVHSVRFVGPQRHCLWSARIHWRALRDGVATFPIVFAPQRPPGKPIIEAVTGCSIGRVSYDPGGLRTVCEGIFPTPLNAGQILMVECRLIVQPDCINQPEVSNAYCNGPVTLEVRFEDAAPPAEIFGYVRENEAAQCRDLTPVTAHEGVLSRTVAQAAPCRLGFVWDLDRYPSP